MCERADSEPPDAEPDPLHTFAADRMPEPPGAYEGPAEPDGYGVERLAAFARSPRSLFIYWELTTPADPGLRRAAPGPERWVLRLSEQTSGQVRDTVVDPRAHNHYMHVEPGGSYVVQLGVSTHGSFRSVCSCGPVRTPDTEASRAEAVAWTDVAHDSPPRAAGPGTNEPAEIAGLRFDPASLTAASSFSAACGHHPSPES